MPVSDSILFLEGQLETKGTGYILTYDEEVTDDGLSDRTKVTLHLSKDRVMMRREGTFSTMMAFDRHRPYEGMYETPYGSMQIHVQTRDVTSTLSNSAGLVHLEYEMSISGGDSIYRILNIRYISMDSIQNICQDMPFSMKLKDSDALPWDVEP